MEAFLWTLVSIFIVYLSYLAGRIAGRRKVRKDRKATHESFFEDEDLRASVRKGRASGFRR